MALASVDDVKAILGIEDDLENDAIQATLDAVDRWIKDTYQIYADSSGTLTASFFHVRRSDVLKMPTTEFTVVELRVFHPVNSAQHRVLGAGDYMVLPNGRVYLLSGPSNSFISEYAVENPRTWDRLDVVYTSAGTVPASVRRAAAMIAAATYDDSPQESAMRSESIGGYSYSRGNGVEVRVPDRARTMLSIATRRPRVVVT